MDDSPDRVHARRWWTLAVLCLSLLVVVVDNTIVNVALPTLARDLHASTTSLQWVVDAYSLAMAGLLLTLGSLGDRIGRHRTLAAGLVTFGLGSLLASLCSSSGQLIACRVLMGAGAAAIMPATLSILTGVFTDPAERARAIGLWAAVSGLGIAIGPTLGGWLLSRYSWGSIFLVNVPIVVVALVAGAVVVPRRAPRRRMPLDPIGATLSAVGLLAVVYAVIEAPDHGWLSASTVGLVGVGLVLLALFVAWERHTANPMLDLSVFSDPRFSAAAFTVMMVFLSLFGWLFLFTQQLQVVLGYDTLQAGLRALPFAVAIGIVSSLGAPLAARVGTKVVVASGLVVMAGGYLALATSTAQTSFAPRLLIASVVVAIGMGLVLAPATESIMGSLDLSQAGAGSAVNDTTQELGGVIGVAVIGSVALTVFGHQLHLGRLPAPLAATARSSVGAAMAVDAPSPSASADRCASRRRTPSWRAPTGVCWWRQGRPCSGRWSPSCSFRPGPGTGRRDRPPAPGRSLWRLRPPFRPGDRAALTPGARGQQQGAAR